jgi:hypothetical protein
MILVATPVIAAEASCFVFTKLRPDLFDQRQVILANLQPERFQRFKKTSASNILGWDNPAAAVQRWRSCAGETVTYTYGEHRERLHGRGDSPDAVILVAGDSFTHGDDASDDETYPAALERMVGVPVANLGVPGYGPLQALLKLEGSLDRFPRARVAILSIMHDDGRRMLNSFHPILFSRSRNFFGLKPYLRAGEVHGLVGGDPFVDLAAMRKAAELAFDSDYWRRPRSKFPYLWSVAEMMTLPSFWLPRLAELSGRSQYDFFYSMPSVQTNLRVLYERFANWTRARDLRGMVVFIPGYPVDRTSGPIAISAATDAQRATLTFISIEFSDPTRYRYPPGCHPLPEGYRMIAEGVSTGLRPVLAERASPERPRTSHPP